MKIGRQSAKQSDANVMKGLRNMPAKRGRAALRTAVELSALGVTSIDHSSY